MRRIFINAAVVAMAAFGAISCSETSKSIDLFNGKDLSNWTMFVDPESGVDANSVYSVSNGLLRIEGVPFGYIHTNEKYSDFKLHVEWRWADGEGTNSGIFLLVQDPAKLWPNGIECQLCKGSAGDFVLLGGSDLAEFKLKEGEERPKFPVVASQVPSNEKAVGEWNAADITCQDGNITVYINGKLQNQGSGAVHKSGYIALQSEGGPVEFQNVKLEKL